jgi:hypothetical protein
MHEDVDDCLVRVADGYGVSLDHEYEVRGDDVYHRVPGQEEEQVIDLVQFPPIEQAIAQIFEEHKLDRLGGRSTGSGWSNISKFQRCPYLWKRTYLDPLKIEYFGIEGEIIPLAIGILVHTYLALYYQRMIVGDYPLTPEHVNQRVRELGCNPDVFNESWRLFTGYRLFYQHEDIQPMAVEMDLRDPRTNDSCRYDLVAFFPKERPGMPPGTYVIEHKTAARFDANTLEGWVQDGEVLGQIDLWDRLHLSKRFGPLRGVMVNLIGKQKVAEFHRTLVAPTAFLLDQHRSDLKRWNGLIQLARSFDTFPRARNNCIRGFSRCSLWDHCVTTNGG